MKIWFGVVTPHLQASKAFYERLLGAEPVFDSDWFVLMRAGDTELGFLVPGHESQALLFRPAYTGSGVWIAVEVPDVDTWHERVQSLGIPIEVTLRDEPWGDRHFALRDPNGVGVDFVTRG